MQISNLMVVSTPPKAWHDPFRDAERLRDFLLSVLDPAKDGRAMLGRHTPEERAVLTWVGDREGSEIVMSEYEEVWVRGARLLEGGTDEARDLVFETFRNHTLELFADGARLDACFDVRDEAGDECCLGLRVGWMPIASELGFTLFCMPELRISTFWPSSGFLAPPSDASGGTGTIGVDDAAYLLEGGLIPMMDSLAFDLELELDPASLQVHKRRILAPVFCYAEPISSAVSADVYLAEPAVLKRLGAVVLATNDPLSSGTTAAVLEGKVLALRREAFRSDDVRPRYLMLLPRPTVGGDPSDEAESVLYPTRQLTYLELVAALRAHDLARDLAGPVQQIGLWAGAVDPAVELVRDLHDLALFEPPGGGVRTSAYDMVNHIRRALARLQGDLLRVTDGQQGRLERLSAALGDTTAFAKRSLAARRVEGLDSLVEGVPDFFPYRWMAENARYAAVRAQRLRETFHGVETAVHDLLEQERRDERERETRLVEDVRRRQERGQHMLGYALAALAAVSAFPILIGQMDWTELRAIVDDWPSPFGAVGMVLTSAHPYLVLVATIAAGATIVALLVLLVWTLVRPPSSRTTTPEPDELERMGKQVQRAWQLARDAARIPPWQLADNRRRLDELDRHACENLVQVWAWLVDQDRDRPEESNLERLRRSVRSFVIRTELFARRPEDFRLPLALCLIRFKSTDFYRVSAVSDVEFAEALTRLGFDHFELEALDSWVDSEVEVGTLFRDLPAAEFVQSLRDRARLSALREEPIMAPELRAR